MLGSTRPPGPVRVLVVDDDHGIRESLSGSLEEVGYEVRCAANGRDALVALESGDRPDVILLDLLMPLMDGAECYGVIQSRPEWAVIPVIVITASGKHGAIPATVVLAKPFSIDDLVAQIERVTR